MRFLRLYPVACFIFMVITSLIPLEELEAHALAPSLLILKEGEKTWSVIWKTPLQRVDGGRLAPRLPKQCRQSESVRNFIEQTARVSQWQMDCRGETLAGYSISVEGIGPSRANAILRIIPRQGTPSQAVLTASSPAYVVPLEQSALQAGFEYFGLGVTHLIGGLDHVLFLVALMAVSGFGKQLIWLVSAFTIGHAITLSASALGAVHVSQGPVEILIALSVLLAIASVGKNVGDGAKRNGLILTATLFGLLHGLGFAGVLTDIGLPHDQIVPALLGFNLGIEIAQLLLIAAVFLVSISITQLSLSIPSWCLRLPLYLAGCMSGFWFWQRTLPLIY